ncbi:DNA mismatch repair protein [Rhizopus stolonifer]|uniref:DNA mismatch repair protein n=1 Tax=Rhizopus stolonifer TaxID=4846 RepID=A0A367KSX6_RHIST|nr:DNA mismatch repair protein [Rhizopus stolonifer]
MSNSSLNNSTNVKNAGLQEIPEKSESGLHVPQKRQKSVGSSYFNRQDAPSGKTTKKMSSAKSSKEFSVDIIQDDTSDSNVNVVPSAIETFEEETEKLESIYTIKSEIKNAEDKRHLLVDYIDSNLVIAAYKDRCYLMNPSVISEEFFYQIIIHQFGHFGSLALSTPIPLYECFTLFTQDEEELAHLQKTIINQREILENYFKLLITLDGQIKSLPMLVDNYIPSFDRFPFLLYNIATQIDWRVEIDCLEGLAREFSMFYCISNKAQWEQVVNLLHQSLFQTPGYIGRSGYLIELDIPPQFLEQR